LESIVVVRGDKVSGINMHSDMFAFLLRYFCKAQGHFNSFMLLSLRAFHILDGNILVEVLIDFIDSS